MENRMQGIKLKVAGEVDLSDIENPFGFVIDKFNNADIVFDERLLQDSKKWIAKNKIIEKHGKFIGFLDYELDENGISFEVKRAIFNDIKKLKTIADYIIILVRWGIKGERYPIPWQRELAFKMVDYGADLILGYGPCVAQGIEKYNDRLIVYSLGRFIGYGDDSVIKHDMPFKDQFNRFRNHSFVLDLEFFGDNVIWDIEPVVVRKDGRPEFVHDLEFKRFVKDELSQGFRIANYAFYFGIFRVALDA